MKLICQSEFRGIPLSHITYDQPFTCSPPLSGAEPTNIYARPLGGKNYPLKDETQVVVLTGSGKFSLCHLPLNTMCYPCEVTEVKVKHER